MGFLRDIGAPGLIILILGALLIFGPKRLPELGQAIGKMFSEFKGAMNQADSSKEESGSADKDEKNE
ncbi:Sec-independent protein translocase subunit TatA/TatB [Streptococcus oricebi]|uniref:Twin-arginine translocase TatA/TatE family subunit n=1 Tax=Streptococcus oricebi TaxID=1547447 RepID=A0ABS5B0I9_9STRE|nr:twin-arginine translocase TatA/TatE family subunit [Streptococcus oricebi]MBP2622349.1 twin-arginine translocase TatA/TatE family subunit [Streptococcus oricebi]